MICRVASLSVVWSGLEAGAFAGGHFHAIEHSSAVAAVGQTVTGCHGIHATAWIIEAAPEDLARGGRVLLPVALSSNGVVERVSVLVSVGTPWTPDSLLNTQLGLEARVGIEPTMQLLQSRALPLGYPAASHRAVSLP